MAENHYCMIRGKSLPLSAEYLTINLNNIEYMRKLLLAIMLATFLPMAGDDVVIKDGEIVQNVVEIKGVYYYIDGEAGVEVMASPNGYSGQLEIPCYISVLEQFETWRGTVIDSKVLWVMGISSNALDGCTGLTSMTIDMKYWYDRAIPAGLLKDCTSLKEINITNSDYYRSPIGSVAILKGYKDKADYNNLVTGCKNTVIPNSVTMISSGAFAGCRGLSELTIPSSVNWIGEEAFRDCNDLKTVTVCGNDSEGIYIENGAFAGCSGLTAIYVYATEPAKLSTARAGGSSVFEGVDKENCVLYVPKGSVEKYRAAEGWGEFSHIVEMEEDTSMGGLSPDGETFATEGGILYQILSDNTASLYSSQSVEVGSYTIPSIVFDNGKEYTVTEIATEAFKNNVEMTEVTIPETVTSIGSGAFSGCSGLTAIYVYATEPANLSAAAARTRAGGSLVFEGVNMENCVLYVPKGCVEKYRAAEGWGEFTHIVEMDEGTCISGLITDGEAFDVYDMSGRKVRTATSSLDGLPKGIYVVNGKKVMK